ncbi:hypothetical protein, partial [Marinobacter antarcticus]|uniref:hypothetical protein n=1 Tax=Marinobacter antarcticus TaxID=564117 RepID=UPI0026EB57B5
MSMLAGLFLNIGGLFFDFSQLILCFRYGEFTGEEFGERSHESAYISFFRNNKTRTRRVSSEFLWCPEAESNH